MCVDPIPSQTFSHATPKFFDNFPQNVKTVDLDKDEHSVLTLKPVLQATSMLFEPKQVQSARNLNTFRAQEAGIYFDADLTNFWNCVLFANQL